MLKFLGLILLSLVHSKIIQDKNGILHVEEPNEKLSINNEDDFMNYAYRSLISNPNVLTTSDKQAILDAHNVYRSKVANGSTPNQPKSKNINQLFWDLGLEAVATQYAKYCIWGHNGARATMLKNYSSLASFPLPTSYSVGENLYAASSNSISNVAALINGITAWYNEYTSYTYSSMYQSTAGHYSQLIWAKTRYVGCGWYTCPSLSGLTGTYWNDGAIIFVCDYYPAGNYGGQYPYINDTNFCTQCEADRTKCDNALCGGCLSSTYNYNGNTVANVCDNGLGIDVSGTSSTSTTSTTSTTTTTTTTTTKSPTTKSPTMVPTIVPTMVPTVVPTFKPTMKPTSKPTFVPSNVPTKVPTTPSPTTPSPTAPSPTTPSPTTPKPTTPAPTTPAPTTPSPTTPAPTTPSPTTPSPTTPSPTTPSPTTPSPTTPSPTTPFPTTLSPTIATTTTTTGPTTYTRKGKWKSLYTLSTRRRRRLLIDQDETNYYEWNQNNIARNQQIQDINYMIESIIYNNVPSNYDYNITSDIEIDNFLHQCNVSFTIITNDSNTMLNINNYIESTSFRDSITINIINYISNNFTIYFIPLYWIKDTDILNYTEYFETNFPNHDNTSSFAFAITSSELILGETFGGYLGGGGGIIAIPITSTFPTWATFVIASGGAISIISIGSYIYIKKYKKKNPSNNNESIALTIVNNDAITNNITADNDVEHGRQAPQPPPRKEVKPPPKKQKIIKKEPLQTQKAIAQPAAHSMIRFSKYKK